MSFKLLAIRALTGIDESFTKNLKLEMLYSFYKEYQFLDQNEIDIPTSFKEGFKEELEHIEVSSIRYTPTLPVGLYSLTINENTRNTKPLEVSISAIIGENGSGKSALTELLLYCIFFISNKVNPINEEDFFDTSNLNPDELSELTSFRESSKKINNKLFVELYYLFDEIIVKIKILNGEIKIERSKKIIVKELVDNKPEFYDYKLFRDITIKEEILTDNKFTTRLLNAFFYTVLTNYSLYSLNSNQIGAWIKVFFHKNDGYQMPIVINPFRTKGSIDIDTENILTEARLLTNILTMPNYRRINKKSEIDSIILRYNASKEYHLKDSNSERFREIILKPLFEKIFKSDTDCTYPNIETPIQKYAEAYLIQKIIKIPKRYKVFEKFDMLKEKNATINDFKFEGIDTIDFIEKLYSDRSHVTLKIRQTINFLRKDIYPLLDPTIFSLSKTISKIDSNLLDLLEEIRSKPWFTSEIDYLPPPFYFSEIIFKDESNFRGMSSGEKQRTYSLNSIIYHLKNLDSVHSKGNSENKKEALASYRNVNLVLDEVELYYHPEFQRTTISDLLFLIREANFQYLRSINILLLSHSPFILSDIPSQNILHLKEGIPIKKEEKTFGANVHDLLHHDFFMKNGFMGEWAKRKVLDLVDYLKYNPNLPESDENKKYKMEWNDESAKSFIEIIAEPLIQQRLFSLYDKKTTSGNKELIKKRIEELSKQL